MGTSKRISTLSCKQAAEQIGVSISTLKRMCDDGQLESIRTPGGRRRLSVVTVQEWIDKQNKSTLPDNIAELDLESVDEVIESLLDRQTSKLTRAIMRASADGADSLATCLDGSLTRAMRTIGQQWRNGQLAVYQEHLCSQTRSDALSILSNSITARSEFAAPMPQAPRLAAMGAGMGCEQHSVASRMIEMTLIQEGWDARSLGGSVPLESLIRAARNESPRLVWVSYTHVSDRQMVIDQNLALYDSLGPHQLLIVGGQALDGSLKSRLRFDFAGNSLAHLLTFTRRIQSDAAAANRQPVARRA